MSHEPFAILDYHIGNIGSLKNAFNRLDVEVNVTLEKKQIETAPAIILPGVGQFTEAIRNLHRSDLVDFLKELAKSGKPMLGICLGMQLLLTSSEECDVYDGLNIIPGQAKHFSLPKPEGRQFKIPQIGWNTMLLPNGATAPVEWKNTLLEGLDESAQTYFLHSFMVEPDDSAHVVARTYYGDDSFCSVVRDGMVWGCQFHPERSGWTGLTILRNFISLVAGEIDKPA